MRGFFHERVLDQIEAEQRQSLGATDIPDNIPLPELAEQVDGLTRTQWQVVGSGGRSLVRVVIFGRQREGSYRR
jgi:hypothetical protein